MSKLKAMREQREELAREANALNEKYPADKPMSAEDMSKMDGILATLEGIDANIAREKRIQDLISEKVSDGDPAAIRDQHTLAPDKQSDMSKALRAYLSSGLSALNADQLEMMRSHQNADIRAAMSTTTDTEGGYTTSPEYNTSLEEAMKAFGGMRQVATTLRTGTGSQMNFPTADATMEEGEIVGQNQLTSTSDTGFGNKTLDVFKYSSKSIALPWELLQDSFIDIEGYIRNVLAVRLGRIGNRHFTAGTGTNQPHGIVPQSGAGKVGTTGQTTTVTYDDLVDLEHSIDPAYRSQASFMFHDDTLKAVRKIKDGQGRPIFVPGYEQGNPGGAPDRILNRNITINQHMAPMAANARSILFGDLSKYIIRDVMDLTLFRMTDSAFTLRGQVGFVAFRRMGGNLIDAGGAVKYYQNSAT
ncbi:phage major capsid protein [Parasalinivibrio latis]|uniref:phage major capsid protein n=1 Tax=Parasalinivibrio latis TaxID=2952610 RepID=UPI0030E00C0A